MSNSEFHSYDTTYVGEYINKINQKYEADERAEDRKLLIEAVLSVLAFMLVVSVFIK